MNKKFILLPACLLLLASCTGGTTPSDPVDPPEPPGPVDPVNDGLTPETAFTAAEILELAKDVVPNPSDKTTDKVYIKDVVTAVKEISAKPDGFGNAEFSFGEFICYRVKKLENGSLKDISTSDEMICQIQKGDTVCVYSAITNYNGKIETPANEGGIVSVVYGPDHVDPGTVQPEHGQKADDPLTVAEAIAKAQAIGEETATGYYVEGYVVTLAEEEYSEQYGNKSFYLNDDATKTGTKEFQVYRAKWGEKGEKMTKDQFDSVTVGKKVKVLGDITTHKHSSGDVDLEIKNAKILELDGKAVDGGGEAKDEPEMIKSMNLSEIVADIDNADFAVKYELTVTVEDWYETKGTKNTDATKYGNFYVIDGSEAKVLVYGATYKAEALTWDAKAGKYVFTNPQDFDTTTLGLKDTITMQVVRTEFKGTKQLNAVITNVTTFIPEIN